jgi:isocitrate dehydrogenase (NAD+)
VTAGLDRLLLSTIRDAPLEHGSVLIPGDGIGPEVTKAACRIIDAALLGSGSSIDWIECHAGVTALERGHTDLLPQETIDAIQRVGIALKGPCTTPIGGGFSSVNVALRKTLDLYGAVRPVRSIDGVKTRYEDVDLVVIRENTEGLYAGLENEITPGVVTSLKVATEKASYRIARFAFEYARSRGRRKITVFHKANILKKSDGLFIRCAQEVHEAEFKDIEYEELIIDAACMRLVQDPSQFDMLLCENLYGDVVSDLCAGFVGGLGVTPGANFGEINAVFEAVHGSAPDIAGQGIANPLAITMSGVMMLNHISVRSDDPAAKIAAERIKVAYNTAVREGDRTGDLGGDLGTDAFADALIRRLD